MVDLGGSGAMPWASETQVASAAASSARPLAARPMPVARVVRSPEAQARIVSTADVASVGEPGLGERLAAMWHGWSTLERGAVVAAGVGVVWIAWRAIKGR